MSTIMVTLDENGARALVAACSFLDLILGANDDRRSFFAPGESPRDIAVLQLVSALERQEQPSGFEALGVTDLPNPYVQRTWRP
jgi:hypothetical protein